MPSAAAFGLPEAHCAGTGLNHSWQIPRDCARLPFSRSHRQLPSQHAGACGVWFRQLLTAGKTVGTCLLKPLVCLGRFAHTVIACFDGADERRRQMVTVHAQQQRGGGQREGGGQKKTRRRSTFRHSDGKSHLGTALRSPLLPDRNFPAPPPTEGPPLRVSSQSAARPA